MRLSWNEVRNRAAAFADAWADDTYEQGEAQTFYNELFNVFGNRRRGTAAFEARVKLADARNGRIDLFWPGVLLAEHKSAGADMIRARRQALDYLPGLKDAELPRHILVCDFQTFELTSLDEPGEPLRFALADLPRHVEAFGFIMGVERRTFRDQDPANILASELMAKVHDGLKAAEYEGSDLERYLVRLLFCLFADDTGIFDRGAFQLLIEGRTREDGSDLGLWLGQLWEVLNTPEDRRKRGLDEELAAFPYINGDLFAQRLPTADFGAQGRRDLLEACGFAWETISPAIFGSLFQAVMSGAERRKKGAHYTTEKNILKVIQPLFLDDLRAELDAALKRRTGQDAALNAFVDKLGRLTFLDPACGCDNFLVITYRELRRLETEALIARYRPDRMAPTDERFDVGALTRVSVTAFHGIELEEFPARIAEVAMWMTDHIENNTLGLAFAKAYARIPLTHAPHIVHADALEMHWQDVLAPERCSYVLGNPPFIGAKFQTDAQRAQVRRIAFLGGSGGTLDYVAAWFIKAARYAAHAAIPPMARSTVMESEDRWVSASTGNLLAEEVAEAIAQPAPRERPAPRIGFVATNSITQGEQVAQLWPILFHRCGVEIAFAHRTFAWGSDARGKAHVHVVIVGLARRGQEPAEKRLFSYDDINGEPVESRHTALTAYLFGAEGVGNRHLVVDESSRPLNGAARLSIGSQPIDDGLFTFDVNERRTFEEAEPAAVDLMRPLIGAEEHIKGRLRWLLNLRDVPVQALRSMPLSAARVAAVRKFRLASKRKSTLAAADSPHRFGLECIPTSTFLVLPRVSSERRDYLPIGWQSPPAIPTDAVIILNGATLWQFAVLTSAMHMSWLRHIGGRLKSDYRYSIGLVYNTFPWPIVDAAARARIERLAQAVLDARAEHPGATLAALYDPDLMPASLRKAHRALDTAVDRLYRPAGFASDRERVEHLFALYERLTAGLLAAPAKARRRQRVNP